MIKSLENFFPAFVDGNVNRAKPRDMLYVAQEVPPTSMLVIAGLQHALVLMMMLVYVVMAGKSIGLNDAELRSFVSMQIIIIGSVTLLQGLRTRFSSGHLIVHTPSIISISTYTVVVNSYGLGAAAGAFLVAGLLVMFLARFLPRLQSIFPPEVTGVLLFLLGLSLVEGGIQKFTGLSISGMETQTTIIAGSALACIVGFSIWASDTVRVFAVVIGVAVGLCLSVAFGVFGQEQLTEITAQPVLSFPFAHFQFPAPTLIIAAALPLILIEVISAVDSIGTGVAIDKMNDAKWKRADMPMVSRLVSCHGLGVFLNGLTGTLPMGTSSANLGLAHATGVAARSVAVAAGAILIVAAFLPQLSTFIIQLPQPVMGAIIIYTAGYMFVSGMQLILARMVNSRRMFMIGLSITVGAAIILIPDLASHAPESLMPIVSSGLTMGTLTAIVLNQLFKIGVAQSASIDIDGPASAGKINRFLEEKGADWGARNDVIVKAGLVAIEALETLHKEGLAEKVNSLSARFDEYKLIIRIDYVGQELSLEEKSKPDLMAMLEDNSEEALDAAMSSISGIMIRNIADEVTSSSRGDQAQLKMVFNH